MNLILVDKLDQPVGVMEKMEVHEKGLLHRAFSVFIFNSQGEMLLQKRAANKYHSAGLWSNACCSHPQPGEDLVQAAQKRLQEEMGFSTSLQKVFSFIYKVEFNNGLTEHEYDHVLIGVFNEQVLLNEEEASECCFKNSAAIKEELVSHPELFTEWFKIAYPKVEEYIAGSSN